MGISGGTPPILAELVCPDKLPIAGMAKRKKKEKKKNVYIELDIFLRRKVGMYLLKLRPFVLWLAWQLVPMNSLAHFTSDKMSLLYEKMMKAKWRVFNNTWRNGSGPWRTRKNCLAGIVQASLPRCFGTVEYWTPQSHCPESKRELDDNPTEQMRLNIVSIHLFHDTLELIPRCRPPEIQFYSIQYFNTIGILNAKWWYLSSLLFQAKVSNEEIEYN